MYKGNKNVKLKVFYDIEHMHMNPGGSTYMTGDWATQLAEEFINRDDIEAIDIKYAHGEVCVIYTEKTKNLEEKETYEPMLTTFEEKVDSHKEFLRCESTSALKEFRKSFICSVETAAAIDLILKEREL